MTKRFRFDGGPKFVRRVAGVVALVPSKYCRYWPAAVTLAVGLSLTAAIGWELQREAKALDRKRFALRVEEVMDQLDGRLEKTELLLWQLQDYLMLTGESRRLVFNEWLGRRGLDFNFPWVHGIAVATNRYRSQWQHEFPQPQRDWTQDEWKKFQERALNQPIDCVVSLKGSLTQGRQFLEDYDLRGLMQQSNTFTTAITAQRLRVSGRQSVMLGARSNALTGVLFYAPVYQAEVVDFFAMLIWEDVRRGSARWLNLDSMIIAPMDFRALERSVWDGKDSDLGVELFSSTNQTADTWLNISGESPRAADPRFHTYLTERVTWSMFGRRFSIFFYTTPLFEAQSPRRLAKTATVSGAGISLLATALVGLSVRARGRQEKMAAEVIEARDALAAAGRERVRLGHDLHDGAIQSLYAIQLGLTRTAEGVAASLPASARVLGETRERVDEVIAELRQFILAREADAVKSAQGGLERVLTAMIQRLQPTTGTELQFQAEPGASERLSLAQTVQLTQIARSALANSLRHAQAGRVKIALRHSPQAVLLEIADDGIGFDPALAVNEGIGLRTMQARATEAGGTLTVETRPGAGTRIVVQVSVTEADTREVGTA